jgi:hypothetical protein
MPVYHALLEHGDFEKVLVCNAGHVKNVPGRKTDFSDAERLVHLLECGLLAGSFMPPAEIKPARDVIRYRTKVAQQRVSEIARLGNVLQDAGIKTGLRGLFHRHQVRPGDDQGADRRGNAAARCWPSWPKAGCARRSRICPWRWRAGSVTTTR